MDMYEVLKRYFGYDGFRNGQEDLIGAILSGRDVLGIMPTGAGKSICYQVPALLLPGITVVISPLISLMKDQVRALNEAGIHAAYINSLLTEGQIYKAMEYAVQGRYKIIYVAPERLLTPLFLDFAQRVQISMVTVDEAHCISQWGQDFRPSYLNIVEFVNQLAVRPVVSAFTATATEQVRDDILCVLGLRSPKVLEQDLDWLGLAWDEGGSTGGPNGPYYQSECAEIYTASYKKLEERGLVYPCFCSRAQLHAASAPHTSDGNVVYPGTCRGLTAAEIEEKRKKKAPAYRLMVPDEDITFVDGCMGPHTENLLHDCGDFYLRRADGVFAYQLAVVVDDARMGVTEVVRGADLLSSTARQLYLYRLLGLQAPGFAHCPLLLAPDGRRLSKRDGDQSLENLREKYTAQEIVGKLAYAYGLQPEPAPRTPESLIKDFSWAKVPKQDVCLPEDLF